jgi:hypothetical protein
MADIDEVDQRLWVIWPPTKGLIPSCASRRAPMGVWIGPDCGLRFNVASELSVGISMSRRP